MLPINASLSIDKSADGESVTGSLNVSVGGKDVVSVNATVAGSDALAQLAATIFSAALAKIPIT